MTDDPSIAPAARYAAVYCRKSTEQHVADDAKSVTRQLEQARAYAARHGWTVDDAHVYVDDGISGSEFARRPGLMALLNSLKPRPPFGVLLIADADRLGREQVETAYVMKQINQAGVRIHEVKGQGRELLLDSPLDKMVMAVLAGAAELERAKARERTRDALQRKAERGHVTGGHTFAYDNVVITDAAGRRSHVARRINEAEARVIRQLFDLYASGLGYQAIALQLNAEGALAPTPKRPGLPQGWAPSSVREALHRALYRGELVWGRTQKRDPWGRKRQQACDEARWVRHYDEALRIVSEDVWQATRARLEGSRQSYLRWTHGKLWGRPASGLASRYLLTGLGTCAECGGGVTVEQRTHGPRGGRRRVVHFYGCYTHRSRGPRTCANDLVVPMAVADAGLLTAFEAQLLHPAVIRAGFAALRAALTAAPPDAADAERLRRELAALETQLAHLTQAIKLGGVLPSLVAEVQTLEAAARCAPGWRGSRIRPRSRPPTSATSRRRSWRGSTTGAACCASSRPLPGRC
jgi:site-specific DNA recombinase